MAKLFQRLVYIYIGTTDFAADRAFYRDVLDARLVWEFENFGAKVAAFDLCGLPYLLIADHVDAPGKRLIYEVADLRAAEQDLSGRGWKRDGDRFEVPDGPCLNFKDASGNTFAIMEMKRPFVLEKEYKG